MKSVADLMNMNGRRALITGAAGEIGQKMAEVIAELGGDLILVDRTDEAFNSLVERLKNIREVDIQCIVCDLEIESDREKLVNGLLTSGANINVLINNAAFVGDSDLEGWTTIFENQTVDTWRRALEVNLTATFDLSKGLAPILRKTKNASIINISSIYGVVGPDYSLYENTDMGNPAAYAASKGGLVQLTRWLSTTLAPSIRVNTISPGGVFRNQPESFVKKYESRTPLGRMATEDDFKGIVAYLASDLSLYTTGQNILVDGGWTAL
jgi:NAD(P)-dependent dehydrogenase (short-subunit alcohol dehydrogenase family)